MKIKIYQLPVEHPFCFRPDAGIAPISDYQLKYEFTTKGDYADLGDVDILEMCYARFNGDQPADYKTRSLSMSDVVHLEGRGFFICDDGWTQLEDVKMDSEVQ